MTVIKASGSCLLPPPLATTAQCVLLGLLSESTGKPYSSFRVLLSVFQANEMPIFTEGRKNHWPLVFPIMFYDVICIIM